MATLISAHRYGKKRGLSKNKISNNPNLVTSRTRQCNGVLPRCGKGSCKVQSTVRAAEISVISEKVTFTVADPAAG